VHRTGRAGEFAESRRALDRRILPLLRQLRELSLSDIRLLAAGKRIGALERNPALVAVVVGTGDVRVAPRRPRRLVGTARRQRRDLLAFRYFLAFDRLRALGGAGLHLRRQRGSANRTGKRQ
jgi:hypothetical protein